MKKAIAILAAYALVAGPVFAASTPRDVHEGLIQSDGPVVTLLEYTAAEATTSGHCFNLNGLGVPTTAAELGIRDSAACDAVGRNQYVIPFDAKITKIYATPTLVGDASYSCVLTIEVNATADGTTLTTTVDQAVGTVVSQLEDIRVVAGDKIAVMFADGAGCGGTAKPSFNIILEGQRL